MPGLELRRAGPADLQAVLHIDSTAFGLDPTENRAGSSRCWPRSGADVRARDASTASRPAPPTRCAPTARAGPSLYLAGVAVLAATRGGAASARRISSWLLERGVRAPAPSSRTSTRTPTAAARLYGRLGFTELPGHDIYVEL